MGNQQLILYIAVTIIAASVLLTAFGVERRSSQTVVETARYRAAKQGMLQLTQTIERDFRNMGAYLYKSPSGALIGTTMDPADAVIEFDTTSVPHVFAFRAPPDSARPPVPIRYVWKPSGETVTLENGTVRELYEVERRVDGTRSGVSNAVTEMRIDLLPDTTGGVPVVFNLKDTRVIRVSLAGVSSLGKGGVVEETRFDAVYRPVPMTITDNAN